MIRARTTVAEAIATQWIGANPRRKYNNDHKSSIHEERNLPVLIIDIDNGDEGTDWTSFWNGGPMQIFQISIAK